MALPVFSIATLSLAKDLVDALQAVTTNRTDCTVVFHALSSDDQARLHEMDAVLGDEHALALLAELKKELGEKLVCIFVEQASHTVSEDICMQLDDIWCLQDVPVAFYACRLLNDLCRRHAATLNRIYLDTFIDSLPELIWFKDLDGIHVKVNSYFCKVVEKEKSNVEGYGHAHIWGMTDEEYEKSDLACKKSDERVLTTGREDSSLEYVSMEGRMRTFLTLKNALRDDRGRIIGSVGRARDITDIRSILAKVDLLLDNIPLAVLLTDENERVIKINDRFKELFLHHLENLTLGKTVYSDFIQQTSDLVKLLPGEVHSTDEFHTRHFHEERKILSPTPVRSGTDTIIDVIRKDVLDHQNALLGSVIIFRDITAERKMTASLQKTAFIDPLTGLQNRRGFYQKIATSPEPGDIIVYIDVDKFKQLNDVWGHDSGDQALEMIAELLHRVCSTAVRFGGDEFILYFRQISLQTVLNKLSLLAEESRNMMKGKFAGLSFSMGVALVETKEDQVDDVVRNADAAMYNNKRQRAEYERIREQMKVMSTDEGADATSLETLQQRLEKMHHSLQPYTLYRVGMQNSPESVTRVRTR